jgi:hypothetical protein
MECSLTMVDSKEFSMQEFDGRILAGEKLVIDGGLAWHLPNSHGCESTTKTILRRRRVVQVCENVSTDTARH